MIEFARDEFPDSKSGNVPEMGLPRAYSGYIEILTY